MSGYITTMTETEFDNNIIALLNDLEGLSTEVYADTSSIPTIGIGYALITGSEESYQVRTKSEIDSTFGCDISQSDMDKLEIIVTYLNEGNKTAAEAEIANLTFTITEIQAENALINILPEEVRTGSQSKHIALDRIV